MNITPEQINNLKPNEVFVFGSNLLGDHAGGAARFAVMKFGARNGQGTGMQGQSYAIPTLTKPAYTREDLEKLPINKIAWYVNEFIEFAQEHPELKFLVTPIGCGIAGFTEAEIAPLFNDVANMDNISIPKSFIPYINTRVKENVMKKQTIKLNEKQLKEIIKTRVKENVMKKQTIKLNEKQLKEIIKESVVTVLSEIDRHRPGYYKEYAAKRKSQGKPIDRHRPGYYQEYAKTHPEWAAKHPELLGNTNNDVQQPIKKKKSHKKHHRQHNLVHPDRLERGWMALHSYEDNLAMKRFGSYYDMLSATEQMEIDDIIMGDDMRDEDGYGDWYPGDN